MEIINTDCEKVCTEYRMRYSKWGGGEGGGVGKERRL